MINCISSQQMSQKVSMTLATARINKQHVFSLILIIVIQHNVLNIDVLCESFVWINL